MPAHAQCHFYSWTQVRTDRRLTIGVYYGSTCCFYYYRMVLFSVTSLQKVSSYEVKIVYIRALMNECKFRCNLHFWGFYDVFDGHPCVCYRAYL